ncbi:hypothetical protein BSR28_05670 [Boudabousia liubingyangii]|uniref:zinc-dependent metalloprotease n=1 Tax=Boudabousia liubingyangii TaxID=1921764 RepID=UPI00093B5352|nr:zinc-dependent metalloprotease [Boudabousia liubingyangii]OKL46912.1 hypothetical protein BSR28_05670 [Boudabousia liubingyangii]
MFSTWADATKLAAKLVLPGPAVSRSRARSTVNLIAAAQEPAYQLAANLTGLPAPILQDVKVTSVDRPGWIKALGETLETFVAATNAAQSDSDASALGSPLRVLAVSATMNALATRLYGHYDPISRQIFAVAPNIYAAERASRLDSIDFRCWVVLRSALYALQFEAAPWLVDYLQDQIDAVLQGARAHSLADLSLPGLLQALRNVDLAPEDAPQAPPVPPSTLGRVRGPRGYTLTLPETAEGEVAANDPSPVAPGAVEKPGKPAVAEADPGEALAKLARLAGLMDAYQRVALEDIQPLHLPSIAQIRIHTALAPSPTALLIRTWGRALGLAPVRFNAAQARRFLRYIKQQGGKGLLNLIFVSPENLPTSAELADPNLWISRVQGRI